MTAWQPGDVGITSRGGRVFRTSYKSWVLYDGHPTVPPDEPRRLLVIDPEDPEQARRFAHVMQAAVEAIPLEHNDYAEELTKAGQRALRGLVAAASRPPEPTGLGALVEDESGEVWVSIPVARQPSRREWICSHSRGPWPSVAATKVLSEGVSA